MSARAPVEEPFAARQLPAQLLVVHLVDVVVVIKLLEFLVIRAERELVVLVLEGAHRGRRKPRRALLGLQLLQKAGRAAAVIPDVVVVAVVPAAHPVGAGRRP